MINPITKKPYYEFARQGDSIQDRDNNGRWEVDCSHLVHWAVNAVISANNECQREVPYMTTKYFNPPGWSRFVPAWGEHQLNKWKYRELVQKEYFCKIEDMNQVGPGDVIVFG